MTLSTIHSFPLAPPVPEAPFVPVEHMAAAGDLGPGLGLSIAANISVREIPGKTEPAPDSEVETYAVSAGELLWGAFLQPGSISPRPATLL